MNNSTRLPYTLSHHAAFLLLGALYEEAETLLAREGDDPEYVAIVARSMIVEADTLGEWLADAGWYDMAADISKVKAKFRALIV
jgi:hypothetical protein